MGRTAAPAVPVDADVFAPLVDPDVWTVVVTVALGRTATGAPDRLDDVTVIVGADNALDAQLTATLMAVPFAQAQMPVATRIVDVVC